MFLYRTKTGIVAGEEGRLRTLKGLDWDHVFLQKDPRGFLLEKAKGIESTAEADPDSLEILPPIERQEVWAAGVTYRRSREARMEESQDTGGGDFYDRVYAAPRPELFFKSTAHRTVGHGQAVRIRKDSAWNVPEPELTLAISSSGRIFGYTIGNDMSSRDIEGENPLYLPQAKVYDGSCALGPRIYLPDEALPEDTGIHIEIKRGDVCIFEGRTQLSEIKRSFESLVEYLFRGNSFPCGCFLMTGTGIVPPDNFTLQARDEISITIHPIGTLTNVVAEA